MAMAAGSKGRMAASPPREGVEAALRSEMEISPSAGAAEAGTATTPDCEHFPDNRMRIELPSVVDSS